MRTVLQMLVAGVVATVAVMVSRPAAAVPEGSPEEKAESAMQAWRADWKGTPILKEVRRLRQQYGLVALPSNAWNRRELVALRRGAASLPSAFFEDIPEPLFLERRERSCYFGQGGYEAPCPTFGPDRRTFYIYDLEPLSSKRINRTMSGLRAVERELLQYRRAAVHLVVALVDRRRGWSEEAAWRQINGWRDGEASNQDWRGFNRPLGRRSAHHDFVTFAEAYFARPVDVVRDVGGRKAAQRVRRMNPNDQIVCRMMTRSRFVRRRVAELAPDWEPPEPLHEGSLDEDWNSAGTGCPAFEEWADFEHLDGIELIYAAATSDQPESLYGHLLLRLDFGSEAAFFRQGFEPVYQFRAVTGRVRGTTYVTKGIFGGFDSVLTFQTLRGAKKEYLRYQQRNFRRFRLRLSRAERLRLMQRIWEAQRHLKYSYRFFRHNCASFVVELIRPAVDREIPPLPDWIVMPTDVLDTLAAAGDGAVGPLIERRYREVLSSEARAIRAVERRRDLTGRIRRSLAGLDGRAPDFRALHAELESASPARRRRAYHSIAGEVPFGELSEQGRRHLLAYLYHSTAVERYFFERERFARLQRAAESSPEDGDPTAAERLTWRRRIYRIDDLEERLAAWNRRVRKQISSVAAADEKSDLTQRERRQRKTYRASLEALARAVDAMGEKWNGAEFVDRRRKKRRLRWMTAQRYAIGPSGARRASYGALATARRTWGGSSAAFRLFGGAELSVALMRDELGEVRVRGFRPEVESRALDVRVEVPAVSDWYRRVRADGTLYRYYELDRKYGPLDPGLFGGLGWGMDLGVAHDGSRDLAFSGELAGGPLASLAFGEDGVDFLALGLFGAVRGDAARRNQGAALVGGRLFLKGQIHLYGNWANAARLRLGTRPYAAVPGPRFEYDVSAEVSTRHALGDVQTRPLWVVPYLEADYTTIDYRREAERRVDLGGGLRLEFSL